jgi:hypothetical protein
LPGSNTPGFIPNVVPFLMVLVWHAGRAGNQPLLFLKQYLEFSTENVPSPMKDWSNATLRISVSPGS